MAVPKIPKVKAPKKGRLAHVGEVAYIRFIDGPYASHGVINREGRKAGATLREPRPRTVLFDDYERIDVVNEDGRVVGLFRLVQ